ncbi:hypothetical protein M9458_035066, partial [Cirrhinus mrigala]
DPGFASFIIDQLKVPDWSLKGGHEGMRCQVCGTPAQQLKQQALQTLQELYLASDMPSLPPNTFPGPPTRLTTHSVVTLSSRPTKSRIPHPAHSVLPVGERQRELGWSQSSSSNAGALKPSVQVTMGARPLTGTISSVTIQAQQYLEGMWSISRVNNFLPQPNP